MLLYLIKNQYNSIVRIFIFQIYIFYKSIYTQNYVPIHYKRKSYFIYSQCKSKIDSAFKQ